MLMLVVDICYLFWHTDYYNNNNNNNNSNSNSSNSTVKDLAMLHWAIFRTESKLSISSRVSCTTLVTFQFKFQFSSLNHSRPNQDCLHSVSIREEMTYFHCLLLHLSPHELGVTPSNVIFEIPHSSFHCHRRQQSVTIRFQIKYLNWNGNDVTHSTVPLIMYEYSGSV